MVTSLKVVGIGESSYSNIDPNALFLFIVDGLCLTFIETCLCLKNLPILNNEMIKIEIFNCNCDHQLQYILSKECPFEGKD